MIRPWVWPLLLVLAGCVTAPAPMSAPAKDPSGPSVGTGATKYGVVAANERYVIYRPGPEDTLQSLARRYLGQEARYWEIADFNDITKLVPGRAVVIPRQGGNGIGITDNRYQVVTILAYHRFGANASKMTVTPEDFAQQLQYLADHDYRVIRLSELTGFLTGKKPLPRRAVVITMDDGYASTYRHALPLLRKHGFPATVFVYTDFVGGGDALSWTQMREMLDTGLIDIQSHTKAHSNLTEMQAGESEERFRARVDNELRQARELLRGKLGVESVSLAYPYGDANAFVIHRAVAADYKLAVTVDPGGNAFFSFPMLLHRTMIFGDYDLKEFKQRLETSREISEL